MNIKLLILPNYTQNDNLFILINKGEKWIVENYNFIESLHLPKSWSRGLPKFLLSSYDKDESFVLGQVYRSQENFLFFKSCIAGKDIDGRTVFITALIEQTKLADETIDIPDLKNVIKSNKNYVITDDKIESLKTSIKLLNTPSAQSKNDIQEMFVRVQNYSRYKHFTSVPFKEAFYPPDSEITNKNSFKKPTFEEPIYSSNSEITNHKINQKKQTQHLISKPMIVSLIILLAIILVTIKYYHSSH